MLEAANDPPWARPSRASELELGAQQIRHRGGAACGSGEPGATGSLRLLTSFGQQSVRPGHPAPLEYFVATLLIGRGRGERAGRLCQGAYADLPVQRPIGLVQQPHCDLRHSQ